jgi:hypothetical protein
MKTRTILALILALGLVLGSVALANDGVGEISWTRQGAEAPHQCGKLGDGPWRTADGWIHWNLTQAEDVTEAKLILGGSGGGYTVEFPTSPRTVKTGGVIQFFTPYFDLDTLTATIQYKGTLGENSQFVISDYCPGVFDEELTVKKTAVTSFTREHFWDIDKSVATKNGHMLNEYPKIWLYIDGRGNEKATWTVDVTYEGYEDSDWNVSGKIIIKNTGDLDAVITSVDDVLAGTAIDVDCPVTFPYTLPPSQTLKCTYDEDGYVEGINKVTVTTERKTYTAEAPIVWGAPTTEINKTVNVKDISDLFGEVALGTVTAPNDAQFTYFKWFKWANYGADNCGDFVYDNTATIVETGQSASATLKVNVQCYIWETAYAKGAGAECFIPTFANWGWTNLIAAGTNGMELWAGAAQCDTSKGTLVGTVDYNGGVTINLKPGYGYVLQSYRVYAGPTKFPLDRRGRETVAPGQYYIEDPQVWLIVHAVVGIPDPTFGP